VPETPTIAVNAPALPTPPAGPNWEEVPFDVGCPRCGQDLRGTSEPRCAACSLDFEWDKLIPLDDLSCAECGYQLRGLREPRCPECGERFTWDSALELVHQRRLPLFEYHYRKRPVRIYLKNLRLSLNPWRMWRLIDIHDRPNVRGLVLLLAITLVMLFAGVPLFLLGMKAMLSVSMAALVGNAFPTIGGFRPFQRGYPSFDSVAPGIYRIDLVYEVIAAAGLAWACLLLGLSLLRQSMRRCRVRFVQVFRVWVLGAISLPLGFVTVLMAAMVADLIIFFHALEVAKSMGRLALLLVNPLYPVVALLPIAAAGFFVLLPIFTLALGYRRYLRMPHAWGVALSAVAIGVLLPITVASVIAYLSVASATGLP
jgi:hypothetical protein